MLYKINRVDFLEFQRNCAVCTPGIEGSTYLYCCMNSFSPMETLREVGTKLINAYGGKKFHNLFHAAPVQANEWVFLHN